MANGRTSVDLGFAEFAAQLIAELQEAICSTQSAQEVRRAELAAIAAMSVSEFARRFVRNNEVDAELVRLFPARVGKSAAIAAGRSYRAAGANGPETPAVESKLRVKLSARDLRKRGGRMTFTARGVATVREAVRMQIAEVRLKTLRQTLSQGLPRVAVDSGRVNVKLTFRLVDLDKLGARPNGAIVPLKPLLGGAPKGDRLTRLRLIVRQVNEDTASPAPTAASGIGELDLTFKTI